MTAPVIKCSIALATPHLAPSVLAGQLGESSGFGRVWLTEQPDRDAITRAFHVGMATSKIGVGTGISYAFSRHPLALAAAALDVHELTGGRFALGLGTGTAEMRRRWYGLPDEKPIPLLNEVVSILRAAWEGEGDLNIETRSWTLHVPVKMKSRADALPPLHIFGSGIGPEMVRYAARELDGIALHPIAVGEDYRQRTLQPGLDAGLSARTRGDFHRAQWVITSVHDDEQRALELARRSLAFYLSTASYTRYFKDTPWQEAQADVLARFATIGPIWSDLGDLVPREMVDEFCIWGDSGSARDRASRFISGLAGHGVNELVFQLSAHGLDSAEATDATAAIIDSMSLA